LEVRLLGVAGVGWFGAWLQEAMLQAVFATIEAQQRVREAVLARV
jgi:hypothetical protein